MNAITQVRSEFDRLSGELKAVGREAPKVDQNNLSALLNAVESMDGMLAASETERSRVHLIELRGQAVALHAKLKAGIGQPRRFPILAGDTSKDIATMETFLSELRSDLISHGGCVGSGAGASAGGGAAQAANPSTDTSAALWSLAGLTPSEMIFAKRYEQVQDNPTERAKLFAECTPHELVTISTKVTRGARGPTGTIPASAAEPGIEAEYEAVAADPKKRAEFIEKHGAKKLFDLAAAATVNH